MQVIFIFKNLLQPTTHFACSVSLLAGGLRCALSCSTSPAKCVNLGQTSQAEAKKDDPAVRTEVEPKAYSADVRDEVPAATAKDAVRA